MADQLPAGQITIADLYHELTGIRGDLATVLADIRVINARNGTADAVDLDHEKRLRALEQFRWKLAGMAAAIAAASGLLSGYLVFLLEHAR